MRHSQVSSSSTSSKFPVAAARLPASGGEPASKPPDNRQPDIPVPAARVLAWARGLVERALRDAVDRMPESTRHISGYHFGWWDRDGKAVRGGGGGKAIRPALVLLSAAAIGGNPALAVPAAVAVELVHNFSLLHDDVMDGDVTRRHRPTAWSVFGTGPAILAGDAMLTLAFDAVVAGEHTPATRSVRMLNAAVLHLLEGQASDLAFEARRDVTTGDTVTMVEGKTGALLGVACALGALAAGGSDEQVDHLDGFGRDLGVAFQHVDDLLGIWGDPAVTGKPIYSDLRNRKKSLPVVAALSAPGPASAELAKLYFQENPLGAAELERVAELVDRAGGRAWSKSQADELLERALSRLASARPGAEAAAELTALANMAVRRDH